MILGAFCAVVCALAPWHAAVEPTGAIMMNGAQIGVYVDDTDPTQVQDVAAAVAKGEFVVAGVAMFENPNQFPGALVAQEWYPYMGGKDVLGPLPPARAYIVQGNGRYPGNQLGATRREQHHEWSQAVARHPVMVLTYNGPLL